MTATSPDHTATNSAPLDKVSPENDRQVSTPMRIAYGIGTSLPAIKIMLFSYFFIYFYTNVVGVDEKWVLVATSIAIIFDAISDPLMGQISDSFRSQKWGRRHLFMILSIVPSTLGLILLFSPPTGLEGWAIFGWMIGLLIALRISLTIYEVPYRSLGADLSTNYDERTIIVAWSHLFMTLFSILVFIIGFGVYFPDRPGVEEPLLNREAYTPFVTIMAFIGAATALFSTLVTRKKIDDIRRYPPTEQKSWKDTLGEFKETMKIKSFRWLILGISFMVVLFNFSSAIAFWVGGYLWKFSSLEKSIYAATPLIAIAPSVILTAILAKKWDKKNSIIFFSYVMVIGFSAPYIGYVLGWVPPVNTPSLLIYTIIFSLIGFAGFTGVMILSASMIADIADLLETKTGRRQEGILSAIQTFSLKITAIIGVNISLFGLLIINFPKQLNPSEVAPDTVEKLAVICMIVPLFFGLIGALCLRHYEVTRAEILALRKSNSPS